MTITENINKTDQSLEETKNLLIKNASLLTTLNVNLIRLANVATVLQERKNDEIYS